jgi:zinc protease
MRKSRLALWGGMILGFWGVVWSLTLDGQEKFSIPLTDYKLKNGLEVILSEDYALPIVSVAVAYRVGSVDEIPGKTGLAYLVENLMFSGSADVSPFQHIAYINRVGGEINASVSEDRTLFYQTVPSNQLALVLWLESDRLKWLELTEESFEKAKKDLLDDIRQRRANEPYFESSYAFDRFLYSDFAYAHPLLGIEEDVRNLSLKDAKDFYADFYAPNNAVLCITGNFQKLKAQELVARYFEGIPPGKEVQPPAETPARPKKPIVETYQEAQAATPAFYLGYPIAPPSSAESYALTIIDYILLRGRSSRLSRKLMSRDNKIAYDLSGGIDKRRDRAVYKIFVMASSAMIGPCQDAVFGEFDKLKKSFISEDDLNKFKTLFREDYFRRLSNPAERAIALSEAYLTLRNFDDWPLQIEKYLRVSPSDIVALMNRYFTSSNSVILNVKAK